MLLTKDKPPDEMVEFLGAEENIVLPACNGCAEAYGDCSLDYTGGNCPPVARGESVDLEILT